MKRAERRLAWRLVAPALVLIVAVAMGPLAWTVWESLHLHDLRMPWLGEPFIGLANFTALAHDARFGWALAHTGFFLAASVSIELVLGMVLALAMHHAIRARGAVRALVVLPWALPTVVVAMLFRFMFDSQAGIANAVLVGSGLVDHPVTWLVQASTAWVPVILADVWKTTPFVALLLLAGLQQIDPALYEAAAVDGAGAWWRFRHVTLPLLRPVLLVALIFRSLDAVRVFDLIYVLTNGGPGTSTEPVALYTFTTLLQNLRFGYGAALAVAIFAVTAVLALLYVRALGREFLEGAG
jgi:multiple sugar transport system permease protein